MEIAVSDIVERALEWGTQRMDATEYRGLCYLFVEDCYERGNGIVLDGKGTTATEAAEAYGCRLGDPPQGAYVFFSCSGPLNGVAKNWGHVGIALGDGRVLHAWDRVRIDTVQEIQRLAPPPGWTEPTCIGWAPVEVVLEGSRPLPQNGSRSE